MRAPHQHSTTRPAIMEPNSPKSFTGGESLEGKGLTVCIVKRDGISPPRLDGVQPDLSVIWVLQDEEDQDRRYRHARIERGRQHICINPIHVSMSAHRTREQKRYQQLYLVHHEKWRRRMT